MCGTTHAHFLSQQHTDIIQFPQTIQTSTNDRGQTKRHISKAYDNNNDDNHNMNVNSNSIDNQQISFEFSNAKKHKPDIIANESFSQFKVVYIFYFLFCNGLTVYINKYDVILLNIINKNIVSNT